MRYQWILVIFLLITTGCVKRSDEAVRIGEYGSLTGSESAYGIETHRGIELAVEEANQRGGMFGKKITLITYDDQGKTDEAVTAVSRLITQDNVHVILGEVASTRTIAAANIAEQYQVPMISPSSTNPQVTRVGRSIFRVCFTDIFQGEVMAKFTFQDLKLKKGAVLVDVKSDYSVGLAKSFGEKYQKLGGKLSAKHSYASGDLDFKSQLTFIKHSGAEFLFLPAYYTEAGLIARQARELGFKGVLLGADGWDSEKLTEVGQKALVGSYFSNHYASDMASNKMFVEAFKKRYSMIPNSSAALGYDAALLAINAIARAGTLDRKAIRDQIAATRDFQGATGIFSINAERDADKPAVILKVDSQLQFKYFAQVGLAIPQK